MNVEELKNAMVQGGIAFDSDIRGCSSEEIAKVKRAMGTALPKAYHDFLSVMGREAGPLFVGSDVFFPEVLRLTSDALYLLEVNKSGLTLPDDAVVF